MATIKFIDDNEVRIYTSAFNREPWIMFKDKSVGLKNMDASITKGHNELKCKPIDEGFNDLGEEIEITLKLKNLKQNSIIVNGFLFVNYDFRECFENKDDSIVTAFGVNLSTGFYVNIYPPKLAEQCNNYWGVGTSVISFEMFRLFRLANTYGEYLNLRDRDIKQFER